MGVFDDKKFEELDWISQATEPIDSELNDYLDRLPDETIVDFHMLQRALSNSYSHRVGYNDMFSCILIDKLANVALPYSHREELSKCFEFKTTGTPIVDFEKKTIHGGEIKFCKTTSTLDEKVLKDMLGSLGIREVNGMNSSYDGELKCIPRANEIMELLGKCDEGLRSKSFRKKRRMMVARLRDIFNTNEWNIKDTKLADKVGYWIASYIKDGNLAALSNFCRIKVMTHKGQPIYSMEEV